MEKSVSIEQILKTLEQEKVTYAIIGGVAVVLHGYVRFTKDIDLLIEFSRENVARFAKALSILNFRPGVPIDPLQLAEEGARRKWMAEKNAKVITFYNPASPLLQIDVLITRDLAGLKTTRKQVGNFMVSVADFDDLLRMKQETGRPTDLIDIEKLKELKRDLK